MDINSVQSFWEEHKQSQWTHILSNEIIFVMVSSQCSPPIDALALEIPSFHLYWTPLTPFGMYLFRRKRLRGQVPDIKSALLMIKKLREKKEEGETLDTQFLLSDQVNSVLSFSV